MTDHDLAFASIEEVARLYRKRKLSPVELTKLMLARIDQLNPKLNAYITVTAELAVQGHSHHRGLENPKRFHPAT